MKALTHIALAAVLAGIATLGTAQGAEDAGDDTIAAASGAESSDAPVLETEDSDPPITEAGGADPEDIILSAEETTLDDWLWVKRPIVVFADSAADPRFVEQMGLITDRLDALDERDAVIITDTDPDARSSVRRELRPRGFMLVIMAKDGTIVARKPAPWDVREISRSIDKLSLRQQEIRDRRNSLQ